MISSEKKSPIKSVISGGITGAFEAAITYPTEFIKTYMQLYKEYSRKGMIATSKHIYNKSGIIGFYRGLSVLAVFSIPKTGSRFGSYQFCRNSVFTEEKYGKDSKIRSALCGLIAGVIEATVATTPMETLKVRLIHDKIAETGKYNGLLHGIQTISNAEGLSGLYKGTFIF